MPGATVVESTSDRIQSRHKQTTQWLDWRQPCNVAINSSNNGFRITADSSVRANQTDEMSDPHACGETFAANVAKRKQQTIARLFDAEEITWQVTNCENLARYIESAMTHEAWRTQSPMNLRCFEDRSVQLGVIFLKCFELCIEGASLECGALASLWPKRRQVAALQRGV